MKAKDLLIKINEESNIDAFLKSSEMRTVKLGKKLGLFADDKGQSFMIYELNSSAKFLPGQPVMRVSIKDLKSSMGEVEKLLLMMIK